MFKSVAFGGGGTRGGLHMGVLRALNELHPDMSFPEGIYGCSIGCVFALATAFRVNLDAMEAMYAKWFGVDALTPYATLENLQSFPDANGFMPMDGYIHAVAQAFLAMGIDLRPMVLADAPQPLFFLASNMTTGRPTFLTGQVPMLDALACSGCIPFVFRPRILYGNVYLDGGVFVRCIGSVVPPSTLVIHISGTGCSMTPQSGLGDLVSAIYEGARTQYRGPNVLRIEGPPMTALSDLTLAQKNQLVRIGYSGALAFFAKRFPKELEESRRRATPLVVSEH